MTKKQKNKTIEDKDETIIEMAPIIKEKYTKVFLIISLINTFLLYFFFGRFCSNDEYIFWKGIKNALKWCIYFTPKPSIFFTLPAILPDHGRKSSSPAVYQIHLTRSLYQKLLTYLQSEVLIHPPTWDQHWDNNKNYISWIFVKISR